MDFERFPKIPRLKRTCTITEKIDGTNAQINFDSDGNILCGSRNRVIVPGDDNFGFAAWAHERAAELFALLGEGRHYGEWWGAGIQRRYGLDHKRFSLFNTARWGIGRDDPEKLAAIDGLDVVPVLWEGDFDTGSIDWTMEQLAINGSLAARNAGSVFSNPEGIIIYHHASREMYKRTYEYDERGKPE